MRQPPLPGAPTRASAPATGAWPNAEASPRRKSPPGNTLLTIAYALLSDPTADYHDLGADYYDRHTQHRRQVASHLRSLQRLGYKVTLEPSGEAA